MTVKLVYFAWVRERIGIDEEQAELPADITTLAELMDWLRSRGEGHAQALDDASKLRFAIDQQMAKPEDSIAGAREIAIFPPVTGG